LVWRQAGVLPRSGNRQRADLPETSVGVWSAAIGGMIKIINAEQRIYQAPLRDTNCT